jgi:hypothetical protein
MMARPNPKKNRFKESLKMTVAEAIVTNLDEENEDRAVFTEHEIQVRLRAFGITTVRIQAE